MTGACGSPRTHGEAAGDAVIVAVPMAVLRGLSFSPPVRDRARRAWLRAGLAHNAKLHVPLTRAAGASAVQSVPGRFWTWTAADATGQVQPVLHAFAGTEPPWPAWASRTGPRPGRPASRRSAASWRWTQPTPCSPPGTTTPGPVNRIPRRRSRWLTVTRSCGRPVRPGPLRRRAHVRRLGGPDGRSPAVWRAGRPRGARRQPPRLAGGSRSGTDPDHGGAGRRDGQGDSRLLIGRQQAPLARPRGVAGDRGAAERGRGPRWRSRLPASERHDLGGPRPRPGRGDGYRGRARLRALGLVDDRDVVLASAADRVGGQVDALRVADPDRPDLPGRPSENAAMP